MYTDILLLWEDYLLTDPYFSRIQTQVLIGPDDNDGLGPWYSMVFLSEQSKTMGAKTMSPGGFISIRQ